MMTKIENKAWLQGFAAVLATTWNYTHDAQIIEQAVRDHAVKLKELRAAVDPYDYLVGNDLALHAGKGWDRDGQAWIDGHFGKEAYGDLPFMEHSVIVAVAKLFTFVYKDVDEAAPVSIHVMTPEDRMWFFGDVGWILRDIRRLPRPVPCRGYQRLWALPLGVERDVKAQLDELGRAA